MTWKQLTERSRREWKLSAIDPHDRDTWRFGVRSAMCAANPGRFGPIPVQSGGFGPGRLGSISGVSRLAQLGRVVSALFHRWVVSARFLGSFRPDLFIVGKQVRY